MNKIAAKDFFIGLVFAVVGLAIILLTKQITVPANLSEPGPRLFPYISGIGILICGIGMAFTKSSKEQEVTVDKEYFKRLSMIGAVLVLYYIGLYFIGFLISTPFASFAFIKILGCDERVSNITSGIISISATVGLYALFNIVFKIFLPAGMLFS